MMRRILFAVGMVILVASQHTHLRPHASNDGGYALIATMKILIVEDRDLDAKLLRSVLEGSGHEVSRADGADAAMQVISHGFVPQAVVTDLDLPGTDGITFARSLSRCSWMAHVPIIALTAHPDHFPMRTENRAYFAAYVTKPFNTRTFADIVVFTCEQQNRLASYSAVGLNS